MSQDRFRPASGFWLLFLLSFSTATLALDPNQPFWSFEGDSLAWELKIPYQTYDLAQTSDQSLWIASSQGLIRVRGYRTDSWVVSAHPGLLSNRLTRVIADRRDRIIALSHKGISILDGERFESIDTRDHPAGELLDVAEDDAGVLWVAAEGGLFRMVDGKLSAASTDVFPTVVRATSRGLWIAGQGFAGEWVGDASRLVRLTEPYADVAVRDVAVYQGSVWLATERGVLRGQGQSYVPALKEAVDDQEVNALRVDRDNNLWFAGSMAFGRLRPDGTTETPSIVDTELGFKPEILRIVEDWEGSMWFVGPFYGLMGFREGIGTRISHPEGLPDISVMAVAPDDLGRIWLGTGDGLGRVAESGVVETIAGSVLPGKRVYAVVAEGPGRLLVGTNGGLAVVDVTQKDAPQVQTLVPERDVRSLAITRDRDVWVGTTGGLLRVSQGRATQVLDLPASSITTLAVGPGDSVWVGTERGLYTQTDSAFRAVGRESPLADARITAVTHLDDSVVVATQDQGIFLRRGDDWERIPLGEGYEDVEPQFLAIDADRRLWVAGARGAYRLSLDAAISGSSSLEAKRIVDILGRTRGARVSSCCQGYGTQNGVIQGGQVWLATDDGVLRFDADVGDPSTAVVAPVVHIDSVVVDSRELDPREQIALAPDQRGIEIQFGARTVGRKSDVRYRYRLTGVEPDWVDGGENRVVRYANLPPGDRVFQVQASLIEDAWGPEATVALRRAPALTETWAFRVAAGIALVLALLAVAHLRLQRLKMKRRAMEAVIAERTADLEQVNNALARTNAELRTVSHTDPLTGLHNRRYVLPIFEDRPEHDAPFRLSQSNGLILADIDFFKRVNDRYGHSAGDAVLQQFGDRLRRSTRGDDVVVRWGGEEFLIVIRRAGARLAQVAERIHQTVRSEPFSLPDHRPVDITCSIGAVSIPLWQNARRSLSAAEYINLADVALYTVKRNGRAGWAVISGAPEPGPEADDDRPLVENLRELIEAGAISWQTSRGDIALNRSAPVVPLEPQPPSNQLDDDVSQAKRTG